MTKQIVTHLEEDTEDMRMWRFEPKRRSINAGKLAEKFEEERGSGQVQGRGQQKRGLQRQRRSAGMEACA